MIIKNGCIFLFRNDLPDELKLHIKSMPNEVLDVIYKSTFKHIPSVINELKSDSNVQMFYVDKNRVCLILNGSDKGNRFKF